MFEIASLSDRTAKLYKLTGKPGQPGLRPATKGKVLEAASLVWELRGEFFSKFDEYISKECFAKSEEFVEELRQTDTTEETHKNTGPRFAVDRNYTVDIWMKDNKNIFY
jgi:hypothetical protein